MARKLMLIATVLVFSATPVLAQNNSAQSEQYDEEANDAAELRAMIASGRKKLRDPLDLPIATTPVNEQKPISRPVCDLPMPKPQPRPVCDLPMPKPQPQPLPVCELPLPKPVKPTPMPIRAAPLFVSGWLPNFETRNAKSEILENAGKTLDEINPNWYSLEGMHIVHNRSRSRQLEPIMQASGARIVPVISGFTPAAMKKLTTYAARRTAIADLEYLVEKNDFAGIEIRIAGFKSHGDMTMLQFLSELRRSMQIKNKTVSINVDDSLILNNPNVADDESFLVESNFVKVRMVSKRDYNRPMPAMNNIDLTRTIKAALKVVQHDKLIVEICLHGRYYVNNKVRLVSSADVNAEMAASQRPASFDNRTGVLKCGTPAGTMFCEDSRSIRSKLKIVNKYALKGIAISKIGYGDPTMWKEIESAK